MSMVRHVHITQNNKLTICLQDLNKGVSGAADFLHADKHKILLQTDTMTLMEMVKYSKSFQNIKFCNVFTTSQKRS